MVMGGMIDNKLKRMPRTVRAGIVPGGLSEFITVQAAIDWCNTQAVPAPSAATPYTVEIWPGIYDEQITMADFVSLVGIGPEGSVVIQQADATVLFTGDVAEIRNVTIRLTTPTAGRNIIDDNGQAHTIIFDKVRVQVTTPGAHALHFWDFSGGGIYTIRRCYYMEGGTGGSVGIYTDTGAAQDIHLENNDFTLLNVNAYHIQILGVNSAFTGGGNSWAGTCGWVSCNNGTVLFNNDSVTCTAAMNIVGGRICLKNGRQQYEVLDGMWVQHAITAALADTPVPSATAPYTVLIHPGIYNENITMGSYVYLKGIGPANSIRLYQFDDDNIITLAAGYQEIENVTIQLDSPSQARTLIVDQAGSDFTFERCRIEIITPGVFGHTVWQLSNGNSFSIKHCYCNIATGAGTFGLIVIDTAAADGILIGNDFTIIVGDMIRCSIAGTIISGGGNRWVGQQATLFNVSASGVIELDRDSHETEAADLANLVNSTVLLREGPDHFQVWPGMQIQHALNALPVGGGKVELIGSGTYALTAQVLRAIDDVQIFGMGMASRITLDGVTAVISAGTRDGWILRDFDVDAGLVDIANATNSTLHNISINGLHGTIINPDLGQTNFPGQPTLRVEEIRPLNPALTEIIKDYSRKEYQLYNPTFATPEFIMELLNRQARTQLVPINDLWIDNSAGGGTSTPFPQYMHVATPAAGGAHGLAYCTAAFITSAFSAGNWNRADFDNRLMIAFDMARPSGNHADLRARVQLKQVNTEGILAADGLGIEVQNLAIYGECYNAARSTVSLATTMTAMYVYRVMIVLIPGVSVDFYINDQYKAQITTVANIPSGLAAGICYWVISIDNGAVATASEFVVSPILFHNRL